MQRAHIEAVIGQRTRDASSVLAGRAEFGEVNMGKLVSTLPGAIAGRTTMSGASPHVTCPLCHTADPVLTDDMLAAGAEWCCRTCSAHWDTRTVATVAAYQAWAREWQKQISSRAIFGHGS